MAYRFSQALDHAKVHDLFEQNRYVQVPAVLPTENANRIHKALVEKTPWNLVFNDGEKHIDMPAEQVGALQKAELNRLQQAIFNQARSGFQYCYHNYPIHDAVKAGENEGHPLHELHAWLNSDEFLGFARAVTGFDDISFVDAQATRYSPGQFLNAHNDAQEGKNRRAAYIFNFTPAWRVDWGGYLQLLDDIGNVRAGLAPSFNALNILAVPQPHNVSFVTPFAGGFRFAVSGWFRYGDPD